MFFFKYAWEGGREYEEGKGNKMEHWSSRMISDILTSFFWKKNFFKLVPKRLGECFYFPLLLSAVYLLSLSVL